MELRTFLLSLVLAASAASALAVPVQRYPLDERTVYPVRIGLDAPTTVMFPGPLTAVEGAGVSRKPEDQPPVLIAHEPGTRYFSVRALRPGVTAATNVIFRDRVYAFIFTTDENPDRTVTFDETPSGESAATAKHPGPARFLSLLDRAKNYAALAKQYPALVQRVERATPATVSVVGDLTVTVEEAFRFETEDALVLRLHCENRSAAIARYAPAQLAVQIGDLILPAALTDATGELPAGHAAVVYLVIAGQPDGRRAPLSVKNSFTILLLTRA